MKIVVIGTRGIPQILGGVETHCEELFPRIANLGYDITVIRRTPYLTPDSPKGNYKGVNLVDVYAPKKKSFEAITHTFLAILKAKRLGADVVHIHTIGPALLVPFARMLGMKVVMTHHGPDYDRQKWGKFAKSMLRLGEKIGVKSSNKIISISQVIVDLVKNKYHRDSALIYNGVNKPIPTSNRDFVDSLGLSADDKYILAVGRFVKEKGFHDLINAFSAAQLPSNIKLVIAGDADHPDSYSEGLKEMAKKNGVFLTGFIKGEKLNQIMSHAAIFVLPSYHEGLPIALLEAMSYGLDVAVSDIPANRIKQLSDDDFFKVGDINGLGALLRNKIEKATQRKYDLSEYDWDTIADKTIKVYNELSLK